mmetsp:Transcript_22138/g.49965  ORF Transcript_22138/g.49965 Transcript_22138/m.49965 type:complete len:205 (+) Transcript_22138:14-628(+)
MGPRETKIKISVNEDNLRPRRLASGGHASASGRRAACDDCGRGSVAAAAGAEPVEQDRLRRRDPDRRQVLFPPSSCWRRPRRCQEAPPSFSTWPVGHGGGCSRGAGRDDTRLQGVRRRQDPLAAEAEQAAQAACCEALGASSSTASFRASADANGYCHGGAPCSHDATCTHRVCKLQRRSRCSPCCLRSCECICVLYVLLKINT